MANSFRSMSQLRIINGVGSRYFAAFGLIAFVLWAAIVFALNATHDRIIDKASMERRNLARSLAEHVASSVRAVDLSLQYLHDEWVRDPGAFAAAVARRQDILKQVSVVHVGVIGADGWLAWDSTPGWRRIDLSDREHFKIHKARGTDELFISVPVLGRASKQWSIQFTRPIHDHHQRFAGALVLSVPPPALQQVYADIQLSEGNISLLRADGQILVSGKNFTRAVGAPVSSITRPGLRPGDPVAGEFRDASLIDRIESFYSFRKVPGYSLTLYVRQPVATVLAPYQAQRAAYLGSGALATALLLALTLLLISKQRDKESAELSRARLAAIVENANDAIIGRDLDGTVTSWNAAAARMLGYTAAETIGHDFTTTPSDRQHETAENRGLLSAGKPVLSFETVRVAKDGRRIDVSASGSPIKDASGNVIGTATILRDITERRRGQEMRARLATIVENASDAIIGRTLEGTITSWNAAAERLFGYTAAEAVGQPVNIIVPPDHHSDVEITSKLLLGGGRMAPAEVVRLTKEGQPIDVMLSISPIKSEAGEVIGAAIIIHDISERKKAEETRMRLAAIVENANDAIVSRSLDRTVTSWNAAAERMFGYTADEVIGKNSLLIIPPDREEEAARNRALLAQGPVLDLETLRLTKDGRRIDVSLSQSLIKDSSGKIIGIASILRDITEKRRAEAQQQLAASVFDNAVEGIMVSDRDNNIIAVNRAFTDITGYGADEVIGKNPRLLASGGQDRAFYEEMWTAVKTSGRWEGEVWDKRKNGEPYCELLSISAIRNSAGEIVQHCAIFMDITERKQAEVDLSRLNTELEDRVVQRTRELERANKDLDSFSYSVSHDLRAPLRAVAGFTDIVLKANEGKLDMATLTNLQRVKAGAERMGELIDDLLRLSRVARQAIRRQEFDLSRLALEVHAALAAVSPERKVRLTVQPDMRAHGDRGLLRIVLENLIGNAWKFTARATDATIEAGVAEHAGKPAYFVRDNGAGFDMQYAHKLFNAFQRLHGHDEFEGSGIGLSIVQRIVTRHGGHAWAEGKVGQGATFFFTLG